MVKNRIKLQTPLIALGILGVLTFLYIYFSLPDVQKLRGCITTKMYKVRLCDKEPGFVPYDHISPFITGAVIMSEDASFFSHDGIDVEEIKQSFLTNLMQGRIARGGSTITQQLAKNVFLTPEKSIVRKLEEIYLAFKIEELLTKKRILTLYLNVVEFGPNIFGVRQACYYYFKKAPSQLYPEEAAFLAFLLPNPKKYSQSFIKKQMTPFADASVKKILHKMFLGRKISDNEYIIARGRVVTLFGGNASAMEAMPRSDADEQEIEISPEDENKPDFKFESEVESI